MVATPYAHHCRVPVGYHRCTYIHVCIHIHTYIYARICIYYIYSHIYKHLQPLSYCTGWRRPVGCLQLQVIFRKRATDYRALLRILTCTDKTSYGSSPPCNTRLKSLNSYRPYVSSPLCTLLLNVSGFRCWQIHTYLYIYKCVCVYVCVCVCVCV